MGPPDVFLFNESLAAMEAAGSTDFEAYRIDLDPEEHGLISNGSEGKVKLSIYKNGSRSSVRLERIALTKHVPYFDQAKEARVSVEGGVAI